MTADFPHNGPVIQKVVLFDDTIITTVFICFLFVPILIGDIVISRESIIG